MDGYTFDSRAEARHYAELKLRVRAGEISDLDVHPPFPIVVAGKHICTYEADFSFRDAGQRVILDVKGVKTPVYRLKKKLVEALWGITITEVP